jgi:hypothetical protein
MGDSRCAVVVRLYAHNGVNKNRRVLDKLAAAAALVNTKSIGTDGLSDMHGNVDLTCDKRNVVFSEPFQLAVHLLCEIVLKQSAAISRASDTGMAHGSNRKNPVSQCFRDRYRG